jgi:hypothetical protein
MIIGFNLGMYVCDEERGVEWSKKDDFEFLFQVKEGGTKNQE